VLYEEVLDASLLEGNQHAAGGVGHELDAGDLIVWLNAVLERECEQSLFLLDVEYDHFGLKTHQELVGVEVSRAHVGELVNFSCTEI